MAKVKTWNDAILAGHRDYLREQSVKEAFDTLVATAIELPGYRVGPVWRKPKRSFDYNDAGSGVRAFAFIVNQRDLLFHVRAAGLKRVPGGFAEFHSQFPTAAVNPRGEWTARIGSKADAQRLNELIFSISAQRKIEEWVGSESLDDVEEARLQRRADLGPAEKEALCRARRGHGRYRHGVEKIETGCRLTGLIDRRHLRARHIKPWRASTDEEKLDPHNGLLMSPHIDHLFERGYISFTDAGELMVSKHLNPVVLSDWGLNAPIESKPFGARQCAYLDFHRSQVFEKHGRGKEREARDAELPSGGAVLREIVRKS